MEKISSGINVIDTFIDSFYIGDNVIWEMGLRILKRLSALRCGHKSRKDNKDYYNKEGTNA